MSRGRRRFLEKVGLGAGAALLAPIARTLLREAHGAEPVRKRAVFLLCSNGLPVRLVTPTGVPVGTGALLDAPRSFAWPDALAPLARHRARTLIVDGLANHVSGEHSGGFGALSAVNVTRGTGQDDGPPGGITVDQAIANAIGRGTPMKSLLWGVGTGTQAMQAKVFAAGRERPLPHHMTIEGLWTRLFGTSGAASSMTSQRRRLLLDPLRQDIAALRARLAPTERRAMDHYEEAVEGFETRLAALRPVGCTAPAAPAPIAALEDRIAAMNELSILAVTCGLTNVVGISIGCGNGHAAPVWNKLHLGTPFEPEGRLEYHGHDQQYEAVMALIYRHLSGVVARMVEAWSQVREGDRTVFDNSVIVMTSDNGEHHHSRKDRWPLVVVGNAGGALRADGRFLRYEVSSRSLGDAWSAMATAAGAPTDAFGKGGPDPVRGPLSELLA